jgi:two-component system, NarL family, nitrate/nitrite response regulator NarL
MPQQSLRILLADDQPQMRRALRALIKSQRKWKICGEATDGQQAVDRAKELRPDIVIMDIFMPGVNGLEATRQIHRSLPEIQVLVLTLHGFPDLVRAVQDAGGQGCVLKEESVQQLIPAIESLRQATPFFQSQRFDLAHTAD